MSSQDDSATGKRLGFQFKGTSKRQKIVEEEKKPEVELVKAIEGSTIDSINPQKKDAPLVIPMIQPKTQVVTIEAAQPKQQADATAQLTIDQLAAQELLSELKGDTSSGNDPYASLVIKQAGSSTEESNGGKKKAPLLMQNVAPELLKICNENDRFKYDVSSRAEDLNVRSEIYDAIPVSQFGAALLRGMGWQGPDKEEGAKKEEKLVAREQRLGLGAQARPPEKPKHHKGNPLAGPGAAQDGAAAEAERKEKERRRWEARAQEKLRDQKLFDGDYVWLRAPAELSGRRAVVLAAQGVPGLDRVRVQLEHSGRILETGRRDCVLLGPADLEEKPFVEGADSQRRREEQAQLQAQQQYKGLVKAEQSSNSGGDGSGSSSSGSGEVKKEVVKSEPHHHNKEGHSSKAGPSGSSHSGHNGHAQAQPQRAAEYWLREGIRVKVVSKSVGGSRAYLQKGTVLDVYARGRATVRLDDSSVLDDVSERHVETVLPAVGGACLVLLGEYKGQQAVLVEKRAQEQRVLVQLSEDLEMVEVDMDSIAAVGQR